MGTRRADRSTLAGLVFAACGVLVVPGLTVLSVDGRRVLASGPARALRGLVAGPLDARALDRIDRMRAAIQAAAAEAGVEPALVGGVVFAESRGVGGQRSAADALGLMQLVVPAARDAGRRAGIELPEDDAALEEALLGDDGLNLRLGSAHLAWLLEHRGDWSLEAVLVSYNAGRRRLFGWIERDGGYDGWVRGEEERAARGEETTGALAYARQVLEARERFQERWGG